MAFLGLALSSTASAQTDNKGFAKVGGFAGVTFVPQFTFDGITFDGRTGYYPWLTIKDGSYLNDRFGDAHFTGYGLNAEAGVTVYPHRQLGIGVGYAYRSVWFERVTGVSETLFDLRPRFRETSGSIAISGSLIF